jgi:hypothetical protein
MLSTEKWPYFSSCTLKYKVNNSIDSMVLTSGALEISLRNPTLDMVEGHRVAL